MSFGVCLLLLNECTGESCQKEGPARDVLVDLKMRQSDR